MRAAEAIGAVATIMLAIALFYGLAGDQPVYKFWGENTERLTTPGFLEIARGIGNYMWGSFLPAFIAFALVLLTLSLGLSALLTREEEKQKENYTIT